MSGKRWTIELDGTTHQIAWIFDGMLERGKLRVDGQPVEIQSRVLHPLQKTAMGYAAVFNKHVLAVFVYPERWRSSDELFVDMQSIDTGKPLLDGVPPHYAVLELPVYADDQGIRRAYQELKKKLGDPRAEISENVRARVAKYHQRAEAAYKVLRDSEKRTTYDLQFPQVVKQRRRAAFRLWGIVISGSLMIILMILFFVFMS